MQSPKLVSFALVPDEDSFTQISANNDVIVQQQLWPAVMQYTRVTMNIVVTAQMDLTRCSMNIYISNGYNIMYTASLGTVSD